MEPVLSVRDLCKTFRRDGKPDVFAVQNVSFDLFPGEILGIVGESGSGKSTLAKCVTRLHDPTSGTVTLLGRDITHAGTAELRKAYRAMQMIFQNPNSSFNPRRTLGWSAAECLRASGVAATERERIVARLFVECGLSEDLAARYPHEVSGGQCQRAAIARALAAEPKVLICDEATSALDVTVQKQIVDLLGRLRREKGLALLFICHNLALVQQFCDRVLVMREGRVVEEGRPDDVIASPRHEYTRKLIDAVL